MIFDSITSSRSFRLIPAQGKKESSSRTFHLIPAQDNKRRLIKILQEILPEGLGYAANFHNEKENFGVDIIVPKDEYIADIASIAMLDISVIALLNFIEISQQSYGEGDFIKLLVEQVDIQVAFHNIVSSIRGLKYPKSMDESICARALKKYIEKKAQEFIAKEELDEIKKSIDVYNGFISSYEELLQSGAYLDEELRDDVFNVFEKFTDTPDDIDTMTLMRIEKVVSSSKHTTSYFS